MSNHGCVCVLLFLCKFVLLLQCTSFEPIDLQFLSTVNLPTRKHLRQMYLRSYEKSWPGQAFQLNQDPDSNHGSHSNPWSLQTVIHNAGLLFSQAVDPPRWMFGCEVLSTQGFPVVAGVWNLKGPKPNTPLCSFNVPRTTRSSRAAAEQAGNGMSVLVMTVVQMHSLACYHYAKPGRILSSVALASKYQRQMMIEAGRKRRQSGGTDGDADETKRRWRVRGKQCVPNF